MLRELHIKNFSIINELHVEFGEGLNVLTGETGAGKSIIINALSLALGERASGDVIRKGAKEAVIEAFFDVSSDSLPASTLKFLEENGIESEEGFILKRIISAQGKNRAFINSSMVTVQLLSGFSRSIIDIHGQYEHQSLLSPENQLDMLDAYGGLFKERQGVNSVYAELCDLRRKIDELQQRDKERAQRLDILQFQINEIDAAGLNPGEEEGLVEEIRVQSSAVHLVELATNAYESLYSSDSSCITTFSKVLDAMREIAEIDRSTADQLAAAEEALPLLEETGYFLRDYRDRHEFMPERLDQAQERLEIIKGLKRKYGGSIQEILEFRDRAVTELEELQYSEERLDSLQGEIEGLKEKLTKGATQLSRKRKKAARKIEDAVIAQLTEVAMPHTRFSISIRHEEGSDTTDGLKVTSRGIDVVEFLISPNIGEDLRPLARTASGGELSRIMLALKVILAKSDMIPVLVFDEVDAGIGGRTAETVGTKLQGLSLTHQTICITHLPQIASRADEHLRIEKRVNKGRTDVLISRIEKSERAQEVARMLSGEVSDTSMKHARELLKKGRN